MESKEWSLAPYQSHLEQVASQIGEVEYTYLRREENQFADALARLASMVRIPNDLTHIPLVIERRQEPAHEEEIEVHNLTQDEPWFTDIKNYLDNQEYPPNSSKKEQRALRLLVSQYFLNGGILFKRHYSGLYLRCITQEEAKVTMDQIHSGACGTHMERCWQQRS